MATKDSGTLLFHNTMRITEGHLEGFRRAIRRAVEFAEEHAPQLMVEVFLDEERMLAHSFQLYADSASVLEHWELSDPYIQDVMEHCSIHAFEVYGDPEQAVVDGIASSPFEVPVTYRPRMTGFTRLTPGAEAVTAR
ncbi:hypothetical protein AB0I72_13060 [Nocardiopsis sp. NPDC049922]|uniref:hypothetical protein n=1 Tax=Nocardiopsis sp. NPDC049922 TaxID=3155157 RepID=UPI0033E99EFF